MSNPPNAKQKALFYVCAIVFVLIYAIPKIPSLRPGLAGTYSMVWIMFSGLALTANFYFLFGADKERSQMLEVRDAAGGKPTEVFEYRRQRSH